MTKKDYILIADAIRFAAATVAGQKPDAAPAVDYTAREIADALAKDNPAFDRVRFLAACKA